MPDRVARLLAVTDAALAHLSLADLLDELLVRIRDLMEADTVAVLMLDESGTQLVARGAKGLEEEVERGFTIPVGRGFAGRIAAERRPVIIDEVDHTNVLNPLLREKGVRSLLGVPLLIESRVLGVMHVGSLPPREFTNDDAELLQAAADRAALAIEHGRLFEAERHARELAERRAPAAVALEYVGDGVFLIDDGGVIRFWNPAAAAITGIAAAVALDRPVGEVISGWASVAGLVPVSLAPALTRAETVPLEVEGRELWLSISGVGFAGGTVYAFRDMTTERRLDEWQNEFIATISHEFRTPMAAIYGAAATLRTRSDVTPEASTALLEMIHKEAARLARLVNDVLTVSRLQAGRLEVAPSAFDAAPVAREVVRAARAHAPDEITLDVDAAPDLPPVEGDVDKVAHVLTNLVSNAVKYSPGGGHVVVSVRPQTRHMRFGVADEGLGIPPHERANVFEKFYRLRDHARLGIGGTGLGLYISQELVRRMHGRIWVESTEGRGSTFYFELPLAEAAAEVAA